MTITNCNDSNNSYIAISSSSSSSILIYSNVNSNIRMVQSLVLPTIEDSNKALLCRGNNNNNDDNNNNNNNNDNNINNDNNRVNIFK